MSWASALYLRGSQRIHEEWLNKHGFKEWMFGGSAPRLFQDHRPSGEPHYTALV